GMQVGQWHKQQGGEWYECVIQSNHGFMRTCFYSCLPESCESDTLQSKAWTNNYTTIKKECIPLLL
ncbi:MAG: hypothetical protein K2Q30_11700, partial [Gemmataceae bacterium]|nr:hypothetical protein [Gemmataceae bacterium]